MTRPIANAPQRTLLLLALASVLLLPGCFSGGDGGSREGRFSLSWNLQGSRGATDCEALDVVSIVVSATNNETGSSVSLDAPCTDGSLTMTDLELGEHSIVVQATGEFGELAGIASLSATLESSAELPLGAITLAVEDPTSALLPRWVVQSAGQPSSCSAFSSAGVSITHIPEGGSPLKDIYFCEDQDMAPIPMPLGPFSAFAELLGPNDELIVQSEVAELPAARGVIEVEFILNVP